LSLDEDLVSFRNLTAS